MASTKRARSEIEDDSDAQDGGEVADLKKKQTRTEHGNGETLGPLGVDEEDSPADADPPTPADAPVDEAPADDAPIDAPAEADRSAADEPAEPETLDLEVVELTNETWAVEWKSPAAGQAFSVTLEESVSENQSEIRDVKADKDRKCSVEFKNLKPLTKYILRVTSLEKDTVKSSCETITPPSLELPEIEEVQEKCAHLTLTPLPEDEATGVEGYLLLVKPLEDAKDYPAAEIKDLTLKSKLESLVEPPFYIAYEFTQNELMEDNGGQILVGSGAVKKDGRYGVVEDPKLTSGGNYRVVLVVIINIEGNQKLFCQESFKMLVK